MAKRAELTAGAVLGRYELVLRLAVGGMGEVWAARLKGTRGFQKLVALKTLLPDLSGQVNFERMFLDEAALASRIKHPNVVAVTDLGEEGEILYQVMEWVSGESLWSVMRAASKKKGVPLPIAARIVHQVAAGLHAAHELRGEDGAQMSLVHRDVSPQNVLITREGIAKVVDFGVAKFAGRSANKTKVGELRGKVPYMAPENVAGEELDRRADVFALGVLFYQLVSGVHPFLGDDDMVTMTRLASSSPAPSLASSVPSIPKALSDVVDRAMAKNRADRTASASDFGRELAAAMPSAGLDSSNQDVAEFVGAVTAEVREARAGALKNALLELDGEPSRGTLSSVSGEDAAAPDTLASPRAPEPSRPQLLTPPTSISTVANAIDLDDEPPDLPVNRWSRLWLGGAVAAALVGIGLFAMRSGGAPPRAAAQSTDVAANAAPAEPPSAGGGVAPPSAPAEPPAIDPVAAPLPSAPPSASASAPAVAPSADPAKAAPRSAPPPRPGPKRAPKPGVYQPKGI